MLNPDRFIGIEIQFTPEMDEYMGVRNVKRGVEPHGDLRALIRSRLQKWIPQARAEIQNLWGVALKKSKESKGEHSDILEVVKKADRTLPKSKGPRPDQDRDKKILDKLAEDTGHAEPGEKAGYLSRISELPFVVETVDFPGMSFIDIQHLSHQIVIRLNVRHPFYQELWQPIRAIAVAPAGSVSGDEATSAARRTIEALTLLVIAYAKAESMDVDPARFTELRDDWGKFLRSLMEKSKTCCSGESRRRLRSRSVRRHNGRFEGTNNLLQVLQRAAHGVTNPATLNPGNRAVLHLRCARHDELDARPGDLRVADGAARDREAGVDIDRRLRDAGQ